MQNSNHPETKQASKAKKNSRKENVSSNSSGRHKHPQKQNVRPESTSSQTNIILMESNTPSKGDSMLERQKALPARCEDKPYVACVKMAAYLQQLRIDKDFTPALDAEYKLLEKQLLLFIPHAPLSPRTYGEFVTLVLIGNRHITKAVLERLYGLLQQNELDGEPLLSSIHQALAHILVSGQPVNKDFLSPLIPYLLEKTLALQNKGELDAAGVNQGLQSLYYLLTLLQQRCQSIRRELLSSLKENFAQLEKKLPEETIKKQYPGYYFLLQQLQAQRSALKQYNKSSLDKADIKKEKKTKRNNVILEPLKGTIQIATGVTLLLSVISLTVLTSGITTFMIGFTAKMSGDLAWKGLKRYGKTAASAYDFYKLTAEEKQKASEALIQLCDNLDLARLLTLQTPSEAAEIINQLSHFLCYYSLPQVHPLVGLVSSVLKKLYSTKFTPHSISASCDSTLQRFVLRQSDSLSRAGYNVFVPLMDRNTGEKQLAAYASTLLSLPESTLTKYQSYTQCLSNEKKRFSPQGKKEERNFKRLKKLENHIALLTDKKEKVSEQEETIELEVNCKSCWDEVFPQDSPFVDIISSLGDALISPPVSLVAKEQFQNQWKKYERHGAYLKNNRYPYSNWSQMLKAELDGLIKSTPVIQSLLTEQGVSKNKSSKENNAVFIQARILGVEEKITNILDKIKISPGMADEATKAHLAILLNRLKIKKMEFEEKIPSRPFISADEVHVKTIENIDVWLEAINGIEEEISPRLSLLINPANIPQSHFSSPIADNRGQSKNVKTRRNKSYPVQIDYLERDLTPEQRLNLQDFIKEQGMDDALGYIDNSVTTNKNKTLITGVSFMSEKAAASFEKTLYQEISRLTGVASNSSLPQG
ncbi:MAG: hypothetical protein K2Q14_00125 [Gammaproteobacteria bacterium]|nr:hypothetical protein [Gammaproteobacteria bacterium]